MVCSTRVQKQACLGWIGVNAWRRIPDCEECDDRVLVTDRRSYEFGRHGLIFGAPSDDLELRHRDRRSGNDILDTTSKACIG